MTCSPPPFGNPSFRTVGAGPPKTHIGPKESIARSLARKASYDEAYLWPMHHEGGWQLGAWGGFVCVLLAANGLAHDLPDQALIFFGCAVLLFLWAAWFARARH